ncbi:hypothetical protein VPH35_081792 [Triticum aestivum]
MTGDRRHCRLAASWCCFCLIWIQLIEVGIVTARCFYMIVVVPVNLDVYVMVLFTVIPSKHCKLMPLLLETCGHLRII